MKSSRSVRASGQVARVAAVVAALAVPAAAAAPASAAAIGQVGSCAVNPSPSRAGNFLVVGAGFIPGDEIDLAGNGVFAQTHAAADGSIAVVGQNPILPSIGPDVAKVTLTANDETNGVTGLATAQITVANFAVAISPSVARPQQTVTWRFSGFRPGRTVYAHYRHGAKTLATVSFGKASGPCGTGRARKRFFPGHPSHSTYSLVLDQVKRYSARARPTLIKTLEFF